jgi:polyhydroxybutyrate depolymerase
MRYLKMRNLFLLVFVLIQSGVTAQTTIVDSIIHNGVWRNYRLFLPSGFSASDQLPLVFNLHGYTSNALEQELYTSFNSVADSAKVVVCHPNGLNNSWNVIGAPGIDDVGFIDALITLFYNQYSINLNRVYSTGLSNGGFMSSLLACTLSGRIAAIAPVAGTNFATIQNTCSPGRKVPVLYIHGTNDPVVNYSGAANYASAVDFSNLWSSINNCSALSDTFQLPDVSISDSCTAERITWLNCDSSKNVIHYRILNGGHTWPGAFFPIGITNQDFNASKIIWEFFSQNSLNTYVEDNPESKKISISPNPFSQFTEINLPYAIESGINIFSVDGRLLKSMHHTEKYFRVDLDDLKPGFYLMNVYYQKSIEAFRILKVNRDY